MKNLKILAVAALTAFCLSFTAGQAWAIDGSLYVAPKVMYSYEMIDQDNVNLTIGGWSRSFLGGDSNDSVFGFGLAVGYNMANSMDVPLRLEAEYMYRAEANSNLSDSIYGLNLSRDMDITAHSIFFNAYYDFYTSTAFTPYIGAGLGLAYLDGSYVGAYGNQRVTGSSSSWNFAWNVGLGMAYALNETVTFDLGYRYSDLGTLSGEDFTYTLGGDTISTSNDADVRAHEVLLSLRFNLD